MNRSLLEQRQLPGHEHRSGDVCLEHRSENMRIEVERPTGALCALEDARVGAGGVDQEIERIGCGSKSRSCVDNRILVAQVEMHTRDESWRCVVVAAVKILRWLSRRDGKRRC